MRLSDNPIVSYFLLIWIFFMLACWTMVPFQVEFPDGIGIASAIVLVLAVALAVWESLFRPKDRNI